MLVSERERVRYDVNRDCDYRVRDDRFARYDYETRYEEERNRTSDSYRDSLMSSLERPATRSRLERSDEDRFGFYMSNISAGENNYDKYWDAKQAKQPSKRSSKKKMTFIAAYLAVALVAIIAVTLSVVGVGSKEPVAVKKTLGAETLSASAEVAETAAPGLASAESNEEKVVAGGENYIMLKSGEIIAIQVPEQVQATEEEEKGFDKFCSWLNGVFGG